MASHFSSVFSQLNTEIRGILDGIHRPSPERLAELLARSECEPLGLRELAELLEIGNDERPDDCFEQFRAFALSRWRRERNNRLRYVAPIYVSSFCVDTCAYCNFAASRTATVRKRLSVEELQSEIATVMASGARVIELVYASDPEFTPELLSRYTRATADALGGADGSGVLLCTEYLTQGAYAQLKDAGLDGIVQWDETLDEAAYMRWHASSPHKRAFQNRMDNHDRALAAGLEAATGILFGLADFRYDVLMQIAKARHMAAAYGRGPFAFGTARLKPIAGHDLRLKTSASDHAWETSLMVYQTAIPESGRWLQTRESFEVNLRNLLHNDVFTYRCGDVTPGGYKQIENAQPLKRGQFGVNELSRDYVERELALRQFRIDYAWMDVPKPLPSGYVPKTALRAFGER